MPKSWPAWLGLLLGLAALAAALQLPASEVEQWRHAARWTARCGFFLFLIAYSARPLSQLAPTTLTRAMMRQRRYWGLGFAASHTVHLFAFVTYFRLADIPAPVPVLIGGGLGYALLYAMALTSNRWGIRTLGRNWKRLHSFGIHYIWLIFAFDYISRSFQPETRAMDMAFSALLLGALGLRIAAQRKT